MQSMMVGVDLEKRGMPVFMMECPDRERCPAESAANGAQREAAWWPLSARGPTTTPAYERRRWHAAYRNAMSCQARFRRHAQGRIGPIRPRPAFRSPESGAR